jgi:hypothetical protein
MFARLQTEAPPQKREDMVPWIEKHTDELFQMVKLTVIEVGCAASACHVLAISAAFLKSGSRTALGCNASPDMCIW